MTVTSEPSHQPNAIDVHVGLQVRLRRKQLKYTQEKLAQGLGLTFQQVQKYERGANRISASKLYEIALALKVTVPWFFEGLGDPASGEAGDGGDASAFAHDFLLTQDGVELANLFPKIPDSRVRGKIVDLVRAMAEGPPTREQ